MKGIRLNVVRYYHNGVLLDVPIVTPDLYVISYDQEVGSEELHCLRSFGGKPDDIVLTLDRVVSISFQLSGIWVDGLQRVMAAPTASGGYSLPMIREIGEIDNEVHKRTALADETEWHQAFVFQQLLLTQLSVLELVKNSFFMPASMEKMERQKKAYEERFGVKILE